MHLLCVKATGHMHQLLTDDRLLVVYYWLPKAIEVRRKDWL